MSDPACALRRLDGYAAHSRKELHALTAGKARDCRSALLISSGSTFEACASACAEQPFCEAITWAQGACYGRTAGTPADLRVSNESTAAVMFCAPCDLQARLDAACASACGSDAVARNIGAWAEVGYRNREEDFVWRCFPTPPLLHAAVQLAQREVAMPLS